MAKYEYDYYEVKLIMNETEVRQLRAYVYSECSDYTWVQVRENWMRPDSIAWLKARKVNYVNLVAP